MKTRKVSKTRSANIQKKKKNQKDKKKKMNQKEIKVIIMMKKMRIIKEGKNSLGRDVILVLNI